MWVTHEAHTTGRAVAFSGTLEECERVAGERRWVYELEPPATADEKVMVELVCDVLRVAPVSMTDNLVLLGADSVVMVELSAAITERLGVTPHASDLFEADTVRDLTRLVTGARAGRPA